MYVLTSKHGYLCNVAQFILRLMQAGQNLLRQVWGGGGAWGERSGVITGLAETLVSSTLVLTLVVLWVLLHHLILLHHFLLLARPVESSPRPPPRQTHNELQA